mmetsp:Transcript_1269/g.2857  ORF Transcript_1269/g.2857 Transcript_1269/m.2857 type:complete len:82 (-) Transcript_1269:182-427(-)
MDMTLKTLLAPFLLLLLLFRSRRMDMKTGRKKKMKERGGGRQHSGRQETNSHSDHLAPRWSLPLQTAAHPLAKCQLLFSKT